MIKMKLNSITIVGMVLIGISVTMLIATYAMPIDRSSEPSTAIVPDSMQVWIPTKEDIEYQDSMFAIIQQTQLEVDTIKQSIDHIIDRLDADQQ